MARFSTFRDEVRPALIAVSFGLLCLGACTGELAEVGPLSDIGVVEGVVREAGLPVPATVRFRALHTEGLEVEVVVHADSTGWYRAALPLGDYRLDLSLAGDSFLAGGDEDTVRVGRAVRRFDIGRGRARVAVRLPAVYEEQWARLYLLEPGDSYTQRVDVHDGLAGFDLRLVPPGAYTMWLRVNGSDEFLLPGTHLTSDADTLRVGVGEAFYEIDLCDRHVSLSGHITGSWQSQGLFMYAYLDAMSGLSRANAACEADGSFRLNLLVPEPVKLSVQCENVEQWYGGRTAATATVFDLQPGDHLTGLELTEGSLRLRFEGPADLLDNNAYFLLRSDDGTDLQLPTFSRNPTLVPNLPPGRYRLFIYGHCRAEPWQPQWYPGAADEAGAQPVDIEAGGIRDLTVALLAGGSISGMFTRESGPVPYGLNVTLCDRDGEPLCDRAAFVQEGRIRLADLADGEYLLSVSFLGGTWWYPGTAEFAEAARLTITDGGDVTDVVWPLPPREWKSTP